MECKAPLYGRADQKFCSDQCRNHYNNRNNSDVNNHVRNVNNALRKNRRILDELCPKETAKVNRDALVRKGYNFNYFTNLYRTKKETTYHFCYEMGYLQLENDDVLIVRREPKQ